MIEFTTLAAHTQSGKHHSLEGIIFTSEECMGTSGLWGTLYNITLVCSYFLMPLLQVFALFIGLKCLFGVGSFFIYWVKAFVLMWEVGMHQELFVAQKAT